MVNVPNGRKASNAHDPDEDDDFLHDDDDEELAHLQGEEEHDEDRIPEEQLLKYTKSDSPEVPPAEVKDPPAASEGRRLLVFRPTSFIYRSNVKIRDITSALLKT